MNESVLFSNASCVDEALLKDLKNLPFSSSGTRRVCLHNDESAALHIMLVESQKGYIFPAHRHLDGDEVTMIVDGTLEILMWDGLPADVPRRYILNAGAGAKALRVPSGRWHQTCAIDKNATYLEVKLGPFNKKSMEFFSS